MKGIRGAICAKANTRESIFTATQRLLRTLMERNDLELEDVCAAFFTMTPDLDSDFPAYAARDMGWKDVPMLGAQETSVPGAHERAIRVLVLARGVEEVRHVYLGEAASMRPDLTEPGDDRLWTAASESGWAAADSEVGLGHLLVVGTGLIGASVAGAARRTGLFESVVGHDRDLEAARLARNRGLLDRVETNLRRGLAGADLIVLAVPTETIVSLLPIVGEHARAGALVTDVGSAKRAIVEAMSALPASLRAVAGHPVTGRSGSGPAAADVDLFRDASWVLVATVRTDRSARERVERLVRAFGAHPIEMTAEAHDRVLAVTSHLPAALSCVLVEVAAELAGDRFVAGPGFRSVSRLAQCDVEMTTQMLISNADNVSAAIEAAAEALGVLREAILSDPSALRRQLARVGAARAALVGEDSAGERLGDADHRTRIEVEKR